MRDRLGLTLTKLFLSLLQCQCLKYFQIHILTSNQQKLKRSVACFFSSLILIRSMRVGAAAIKKIMVWLYLLKSERIWMGLKLMWTSQNIGSHFYLKWEWLRGNRASQWKYKEGMSFGGLVVFCQLPPCLHFNVNPIYSHVMKTLANVSTMGRNWGVTRDKKSLSLFFTFGTCS